MIAETIQILTEFICWFIALLKSLLSLKSDLVSQTNLKRLQFGPQKCLKLHVGGNAKLVLSFLLIYLEAGEVL